MTTPAPERRYAGADWIRDALKVELCPFGERVADLLGDWAYGIYHLQPYVIECDFTNPHWIELRYRGTLDTYDNGNLTHLVLLAHDRAIRVEVSPKSNVTLLLQFHPRRRNGAHHERHPTIEAVLGTHRYHWPEPPHE